MATSNLNIEIMKMKNFLFELVQTKREIILQLAVKHGIYRLRLFGSVARQEADELSDVDFLVEMEAQRSLLDMGGFLSDVSQLLGRKVDVVTLNSLKPHIRERVLREAIDL